MGQLKLHALTNVAFHQSTLAGFEIFGGMDEFALQTVVTMGRTRAIKCGETLFRQGEIARNFYLLVRGHLKVTQSNADGQQLVLRFLNPGDPSGITRALRRDDYPGTAVAVQDGLLLSWRTADWDAFIRIHPNLAINMMQHISDRMQDANERVRELAMSDARARIASAVLRLAKRQGVPDGSKISINFPVTKRDIAEMSGTTLHTVSRILTEWDKAGFIETGRQRLSVCGLRELAGIVGAAEIDLRPNDRHFATR